MVTAVSDRNTNWAYTFPIKGIGLHFLLKRSVQPLEVQSQREARTVAFGGKFSAVRVQINELRFDGMTCQNWENVCESIVHSRDQVIQVRDKLNEQKW